MPQVMPNALTEITAYKLEHVAHCKQQTPHAELISRARDMSPVRGFEAALRRDAKNRGMGLIAEIKKASPSKGLIREDFDPPLLARAYERGGATCLSVLTDTPSFQGADRFLTAARDATHLPAIRKDFLYDRYQVTEARALGADAILIILAAINDETARELMDEASTWSMDVLTEVHDAEEMQRAIKLGASLIGVNNRDLRTFETSLATFETLAPMAPDPALLVAESGIFTRADVARVEAAGARALLVGESLMRQADVESATRELLADHPPA